MILNSCDNIKYYNVGLYRTLVFLTKYTYTVTTNIFKNVNKIIL